MFRSTYSTIVRGRICRTLRSYYDLTKMGVKNWKQRAQERKQWNEIIEQAKTHKEL
jgi:predicted transcriptional regulator